jgi:broad specificity phosphatase PhoE
VPPAIPATVHASIVLLRHGESVHITEGRFQGQADSALSALGERQAALAAERLADPARPPALPVADRPPIEIVHSPLRRAARTAELTAAAIGRRTGSPPPLVPDPGVMELAQGSWEGKLRTEIERDDGALLEAWRRDPITANAPGGERLREAMARAEVSLSATIGRLEAATGGAPDASWQRVPGYAAVASQIPWTLVVGHDGIFKLLLLSLLGLPLERFWTFPFALCGLTVVELREGRGVLRAHNLVDHLAALAGEAAAEAEATRREATGAL